ncbi:rfrA pentapeptide repeat-containing protein [Calothrix sp. NIES-4101]|nr:rfrA pentapeptide repeat-containing protein [Calothrix sp. NIES-4101]
MSLNFTGKDLRGRSFRGVNLAGANFSHADIRGTNFSDTTLIGANFHQVQAGLENYQLFLLSCLALSLSAICGFAAAFSGIIATDFIFFAVREGFKFTLLAGGIALITLVVFCVLIVHQALEVALGTAAVVGAIAIAMAAIMAIDGVIAGSVAGVLVAVGIALALVMAVAFVMMVTLTRSFGFFAALLAVGSGGICGVYLGGIITNKVVALNVGIITVIIGTLLAIYLTQQVFSDEVKFAFIRGLGIYLASVGGTSFRNANLTNVCFQQARLKHVDFRNSILKHTNFHLAEKLDFARLNQTILMNPLVRNLLVTKRGNGKAYIYCNLKGANLVDADLNYADFTNADVSEATFVGAWLEGANFTQAQAIKANFQQVKLTGACLQAWNIDSTTELNAVICDYVYLLNNQGERRPSSGVFAPGEFTKLFQVAINTVDLIFRDGLDLQALYTALNHMQVENQTMQFGIRGIENKGDAVVVVKVEVTEKFSREVDKARIHADFTQSYLEAKYQAELQGKNEQIALYRQHQAELKQLLQMFAPVRKELQVVNKLVILKFQGDLNSGFTITLQLAVEGESPFAECTGNLPPASELILLYSQWQSAYYGSLQTNSRLDIPDTQITNVSRHSFVEECENLANKLRQSFNVWLDSSEGFRLVKEKLLAQLNPTDIIRVILQTEDYYLRRLPFQLWNFFDNYHDAELALGTTTYHRVESQLLPSADRKIQILAIIGNSTGIDVSEDKQILERLPNTEIKFLVEPQRQQLNDELRSQSWDILFFAGHSYTQSQAELGRIYINPTETLTIAQLKNALKKAIQSGLQLAIFNSCDGLGLGVNLIELHIPQMIVMREPVPDKVAQEFLKSFLTTFANGSTLYQSVREAREKLQGLENEFPCATWLPVIFQNPAAIPPSWENWQLRD